MGAQGCVLKLSRKLHAPSRQRYVRPNVLLPPSRHTAMELRAPVYARRPAPRARPQPLREAVRSSHIAVCRVPCKDKDTLEAPHAYSRC